MEERSVYEYGQELLRIVDEFRYQIKAGTSNPDDFLTISEIERLWTELRGNTSLIYSDMLSSLLSDVDEAGLIRKKKQNTEKKGLPCEQTESTSAPSLQ